MKPFLIITFVLVVGGFIYLFTVIQHDRPTDIAKSNNDLALSYNQANPTPTTTAAVEGAQTTVDSYADQTGQTNEAGTPIPADPNTEQKLMTAKTAILKTSKGTITIELYPEVAPKTINNFVDKAKKGFYTNLTFHRVEDWVVQGGDPLGTGTGGEDMPSEFNDKPFIVGSLGVARRNDPTVQNDSQFFITKEEASWLDKQYTNFGVVTEGMDVVNKITIGDKILSITTE